MREVLVVEIIELYLHDLDVGVFGQNFVEYVGGIVKREPDVAQKPLFFHFKRRFVCAAFFEFFIHVSVLRVHEVKIEVVDAADFELFFRQRAYFILGIEEMSRQLVCQEVFIARVARRQRRFDGGLAPLTEITVRRIKIIESARDKEVDHLFRFFDIDFAVGAHRQAHTSETEILFYFSEILVHMILRLFYQFHFTIF